MIADPGRTGAEGAPPAARKAVEDVLRRLAAGPGFRTPNLRRADPKALAVTTPHRVAQLSLRGLSQGDPLESALRTGDWRFLVEEAGRPIAAAVASGKPDGSYRFGQLNEGPLAEATAAALRRARDGGLAGADGSEPVLLLVPAVRVAALWVRDERDGTDLLLYLDPSDGRFDPQRPVRRESFLASLRALAAQVPASSVKGG